MNFGVLALQLAWRWSCRDLCAIASRRTIRRRPSRFRRSFLGRAEASRVLGTRLNNSFERKNNLISFGILAKFSHFFQNFLQFSANVYIFWRCSWNSDKISSRFRRKIPIFMRCSWNFEWMNFSNHSKMKKMWQLFLLKFWDLSGAKVWKSCRSRKSWKNEYLVAIVAVDTAENGPPKVWRNWIYYSVVSLPAAHFTERNKHPGRCGC